MRIKHLIFSLIFGCAMISGTAFALDTTETVGVGLLTDFEAYYGKSYSAEGKGGSYLDLTAAGGITENFSYFLGTTFSNNGDASAVEGFGVMLLWTAMSNDAFAFDIMPSFSVDANKAAVTATGEMVYPEGKNYTFGVDFEFNYTAFAMLQPYLVIGFGYSMFDEVPAGEDDYDWAVPVALGVMNPVAEGVEFFLQFSTEAGKARKWETTARTLSAGLNVMYSEKLEVITEAGWDYTESQFYSSVGLIYAI